MLILLVCFINLHGLLAFVFTRARRFGTCAASASTPNRPRNRRGAWLRPPPIVYYRPRRDRRCGRCAWPSGRERFVETNFPQDHRFCGLPRHCHYRTPVPFAMFLLSLLMNGTASAVNTVFRPVVVALAALASLFVGLSAAWRISWERERNMFDGLLSTARVALLDTGKGPGAAAEMSRSCYRRRAILDSAWLRWLQHHHGAVPAGGVSCAPRVRRAGVVSFARCSSTVRAMIVTLLLLLGLWFVPPHLGPACC